MKAWNAFLEKALFEGFRVGLKWGPDTFTYTVFSPSGEAFGRGVQFSQPDALEPLAQVMAWEDALGIMAESALKTIQHIKDNRPDAMVPKMDHSVFDTMMTSETSHAA